jgi:phosphonopyruvate decarboxylase
MRADIFVKLLAEEGVSFFTGVPDSHLGAFCDYLLAEYGTDASRHVIAPNEGSAVALACGHHLATGGLACVYMQNSGIGNAVNPLLSLAHPDVYGIPLLLLVGWRGAPGVKDEPQHAAQGRLTVAQLEGMELSVFLLQTETTAEDLRAMLAAGRNLWAEGRSVALVAAKGALEPCVTPERANPYALKREEAIRRVVETADADDLFVATTGKISRELFEIRRARGEDGRDFLTVGSMGHCSMIALSVALRSRRRVWCLDGDGAFLMHMGAAALIGSLRPKNLVHVVLDNAAHESVGGAPTAAPDANIGAIARACGYPQVFTAAGAEELAESLLAAREAAGPVLLAVRVALGARPDLGRPTNSPPENKAAFMKCLGPEG